MFIGPMPPIVGIPGMGDIPWGPIVIAMFMFPFIEGPMFGMLALPIVAPIPGAKLLEMAPCIPEPKPVIPTDGGAPPMGPRLNRGDCFGDP